MHSRFFANAESGLAPAAYSRLLGYESRRSDATQREEPAATNTDDATANPTKTAPGMSRRRFLKAGEAIRTPDIHVGNVTLKFQNS